MTTLAEKIAVMQAFERGERVQCKRKDDKSWHDIDGAVWDWSWYEYRIAPRQIDLVEVLEALRLNIEGEQQSLAEVAGHTWGAIIERAKGLQGLAVTACEPPAAPEVTVKPLVWEERSDILGLHNAKGADGYWYNVKQRASNAFTYEGHPSDMPYSIRVECDSIEAAKAAAQADYEARILSALEV